MNGTMSKRLALSCTAVLMLLAAGAAQAGMSDAWISAKVKMALLDSPAVSGFPIDVDTDEGRVTLHGQVPTSAEKKEAERIARAGTGVVAVRDLIQVVPDSRKKVVDVADDQIQKHVNDAINAEPALKNSSIHTKSVNKGMVLLSGKAASLSDHLLALQVAASVPGVRQVASEIESPNEFADRELYSDPDPADPSGRNVVTDGWITTQTKMRFMTDADVPAGDINVDTRRGVVTLFGTVPSAASADKAKHLAGEVSGVKSVTSELTVVTPSMKKQATANDDHTAAAVRERIKAAKLEGADIKVEVKAATARLTGAVRRASDRYAAVSLAHGTPGVAHVVNDVRIETGQTGQR